jgi:hypothetical protein
VMNISLMIPPLLIMKLTKMLYRMTAQLSIIYLIAMKRDIVNLNVRTSNLNVALVFIGLVLNLKVKLLMIFQFAVVNINAATF